jgi:hypothetical protein
VSNALLAATFWAICQIESGDKWSTVTTDGSYGGAGITQTLLTHVNKYYGTGYTTRDCFSKSKSFDIFVRYGKIYGAKTPEDYARLWRKGSRKRGSRTADLYWARVKNLIESREIEANHH